MRAALEALAEEPVAVVATLPTGDPAGFGAPPGARVERFIPHGPVLDRAACAITHGSYRPDRPSQQLVHRVVSIL